MVKGPQNDDELWIKEFNREMKKVDDLFEHAPSPSLEGLQMLADQTLKRRRRRMNYELMLFLLVVLFIAGGGLMASLVSPLVYVCIQGIGMFAGIVILTFSRKLRLTEKRGSDE
ncbi:YxlC family protein [Neobacillus mesonae]|nr:YxlC family protein [Neobacillus mesonae]